MEETGGGEGGVADFEVAGGEFLVFLVFASGEFFDEFGVFLVGEVVAGDVVWAEGGGGVEGVLPFFDRLSWDGEHEVDIDFVHADVLEHFYGIDGGLSGVFSTESFEDAVGEGLDAEGDSGDAEVFEEFDFFRGEGGGVGLEGEFG